MTTTCFNTDIFLEMKSLIANEGTEIMLHKRLVAGTETIAKEISYEKFLLELVTYENYSKIIVIDVDDRIPPYSCKIKNDALYFSAYESRIDSEVDIQQRKDTWCELVTKILE